jgi:hypothetical protein
MQHLTWIESPAYLICHYFFCIEISFVLYCCTGSSDLSMNYVGAKYAVEGKEPNVSGQSNNIAGSADAEFICPGEMLCLGLCQVLP